MRFWRCVWAGSCLVLGACGDDSSTPAPSPDGGLIVDQPAPPEPPRIDWYDFTTGGESLAVAPPAIAPCPDGWREVEGACDPWPESGAATDCDLGTAHFPGEPDCVAVGTPCPPGDYAVGLPDDGSVLFVQPGGTGDGSRSAPFGRIADAAAAASPGTTIALAKGMYDETFELGPDVTVVGACARDTVLTTSLPSGYAVIYTEAAGTAVYDLSIVDAVVAALGVVTARATMDVAGVVVDRARPVAVVADRATLTMDTVIVSNTALNRSGSLGIGILAQNGASIRVSRALIDRNYEGGVAASGGGARAVVEDSAIRDTRPSPEGEFGHAALAYMDGHIELHRTEISGTGDNAIAVEEQSTATITRSIIRDTVGWAASPYLTGTGLIVRERSTVDISRTMFERNRTIGVMAIGPSSHLTLVDSVVRDTLSDPLESSYGLGVDLRAGTSARIERVSVERSRIAGIRASGTLAEAELVDVSVLDTLPDESNGTFGRGIEALEEGTVTLRRARVTGNRADGIMVIRGTLDAEDVVVADTTSQEGENDGRGITCGTGSTCGVRRAALLRNSAAGIIVAGTMATIEDLVMTDTQDRSGGADVSGVGLDARDGVQVSARRVLARDNRVIGITASGAGTMLTLEDATIDGTMPRAATGDHGLGLVAVTGAHLSASRVLARRNHLAGLYVDGPETTATLSDIHVVDTSSSPVDGRGGIGALITQAAAVEMTRSLWERNREITVLVARSATLRASHVTIVEPLPAACEDDCDGGFGAGLVVSSGGNASVDHFRIDSSPQCAVWITAGSELDLADGEIARSEIGACVHATDYEVQRLTERVRYTDNRVNIESVDFLAPEPEVSFEGL